MRDRRHRKNTDTQDARAWRAYRDVRENNIRAKAAKNGGYLLQPLSRPLSAVRRMEVRGELSPTGEIVKPSRDWPLMVRYKLGAARQGDLFLRGLGEAGQ